ncbi:MAG: tRNA-dihydrouridine synthase family protein [Muribaculaceae bacterium]|nr:tRNA-dihydrouridine synthase family protein [Muribaculaceae bacterium]
MKIISAPLQGFTEAPWRRFHAEVYGSGVDTYCAPFVRLEHGAIRPRDLRDSIAEPRAVSQIICRDTEEFRALASVLTQNGIRRIDLNLGCPFPPQVKHGRGAGLAARPEKLAEVLQAMMQFPEVEFSAKMRLDGWQEILPLLESSPIKSLAIHARYRQQQYDGEPDLEEFARIAETTNLPLIFNGGISSRSDFDAVAGRFPGLAGIMIGRGLLSRPSIAAEIRQGREWSADERIEAILDLHRKLFEYFSEKLCGPGQILSKIKPFWEYLEEEIGRKAAKAIRKGNSLPAYNAAVNSIDYLP